MLVRQVPYLSFCPRKAEGEKLLFNPVFVQPLYSDYM